MTASEDLTGALVREPEQPIVLFAALSVLLRGRRVLVGACAGGIAVGIVLTIVTREFVAESRFTPHSGVGGGSQLVGLAAQFGLSVPTLRANESPNFYASLVQSRQILRELAETEFNIDEDGESMAGSLMELLSITDESHEEALRKASFALDKRISATADVVTGIVTLRTRAPWRGLAVAMNEELLDRVNLFNLEKRQSRARSERTFIEERLESARLDLEDAEGQLERFLAENRSYAESPRLQFEVGRLQRRVDLRQQVYVTLAGAYEEIRIEEVRNTPLVTVLDDPHGSSRVSMRILVGAIIGLIIGTIVGGAGLGIREYVRHEQAAHPAEYEALRGVGREVALGVVPGGVRRRLQRQRKPDDGV